MRRLIRWSFVALCATSSPLAAQIFDVPRGASESRPGWWMSGGAGWVIAPTVLDGTTGARWDFGDGVQYRASVEKQISATTSLGVVISHARLPLTWSSTTGGVRNDGCSTPCDAEADVQSAMLMYRGGDSPGFHQVLELLAGIVRYGNFRADNGGALPDDGYDMDFAYTIAYGFGYGFSTRTGITLVQDYSSVMHQRTGLAGGSGRTSHQHITRLALRVGF